MTAGEPSEVPEDYKVKNQNFLQRLLERSRDYLSYLIQRIERSLTNGSISQK